MTTITLQIDEKSKKGKALLAFLKAFKIDQNDDISLVEESKSSYNKDFVKKIEKSREEIKDGKTIKIETESIWESVK
ncbi:MAG: DUF2683 family protein [Flavobacterium sp.]